MSKKIKLSSIAILLAVILIFVNRCTTDNNSSDISDNSSVISSVVENNSANGTISEETLSQITDSTSHPLESTKPETSSNSSSVNSTTLNNNSKVNLSKIPAFSGEPFVVINDNVPRFSADELKTKGYENYKGLDKLGRTQLAIASVGKDTMPKANEERGSISSIKPSGWVQAQYDSINGKYLYNRCHLIGWQLSAENANKGNLITGTKYLNIEGMLPFENMVADYIKETGNHVAYRITPIYDGNNLLASGVQMEAYSVEDKGEGICFNVYCYNVQPDIKINYATGESSGKNSTSVSSSKPSASSSQTVIISKPTTSSSQSTSTKPESSTGNTTQENTSQKVYITKTGKRYHSTKSCSGLNNANAIFDSTIAEAKNKNLTPCSKCW